MSGDLFGQTAPAPAVKGMGSHQTAASETDQWLTPPHILRALGPFDLDPCAPPEHQRPWPMAKKHFTEADNGLIQPWEGRVFANPPYSNPLLGKFMARMAAHGHGIALIFARVETEVFFTHIWPKATALLFLTPRLTFCDVRGVPAPANGGAPSVLVAYGQADADVLESCGLPGALVKGWTVQGFEPEQDTLI